MATPKRPMTAERRRRYRRVTVWSLVAIFALAVLMPLGSYVYVGMQSAHAQGTEDSNPRANYWRAVREGVSGYSAVSGTAMDGSTINAETGVLMQNGGQNWRQLRNGPLANYGGWALFAVAAALFLFFALRGTVPLEGGRSGEKVQRWNVFERILHWYTAIMFVVLSVTGLSLLFGRAVLIPLMGPKGFSIWASIAKDLHNVCGPAFSVGVALMIILWIRHNIPNAEDITWFRQGGGMVGKGHPHAGRMNAGEKVWFWFIVIGGGAVIGTGYLLDFPGMWGQTRETMQWAALVHGAAALAWIAFWFGHAYIGTMGSEGSLEAMTTGYVDTNWAKQHHDRWYEEVQGEGGAETDAAGAGAKGHPAA